MVEIIDSDVSRTYKFTKEFERTDFPKVEQKINDFFQNDSRGLILDFENVQSLDSQCLASLIRLKNRFKNDERDMKLRNYNDFIERLLNVSGLGPFLVK